MSSARAWRLRCMRAAFTVTNSSRPPLYSALRESRIPILLLVAGGLANDRQHAEVDAFRRALPQAEIRRFPESGHNVLLDVAEEAIPPVGDWLAERAK